MGQMDELMAGDPGLLDFSNGTLAVLMVIIALSVVSGVIARRFIFPILMDILSKTDRIDGKTLFAPKSLG